MKCWFIMTSLFPQARHQEILSQQHDLIVATQSAQALLDKQANVMSAEEKDKLEKNIQELKGRYEASLTQAEQQMKQVQCVQEELKKFQGDCEEFEGWLDQAEAQVEELAAPACSLKVLSDKLQRQKSFSEDVISHKGDLRFINISGQKVLDVARACGPYDSSSPNAVDTSGTCAAVQEKLDSAAGRYKTLHSQVLAVAWFHHWGEQWSQQITPTEMYVHPNVSLSSMFFLPKCVFSANSSATTSRTWLTSTRGTKTPALAF